MMKHPRRHPSWAVPALLSSSLAIACSGGDPNSTTASGGTDAGGSGGNVSQDSGGFGSGGDSGSGGSPALTNAEAIIAECTASPHDACWSCCETKLPQNDGDGVWMSMGDYAYQCFCTDATACSEQCSHNADWCRGANSGGTPPPESCTACVSAEANNPSSHCNTVARTQCMGDVNCARKLCQSSCAPIGPSCDRCSKYWAGWKNPPTNLCTDGSPSSNDLWLAAKECMCSNETTGCKNDCYLGCVEFGYSPECEKCAASKCGAAKSACMSDK